MWPWSVPRPGLFSHPAPPSVLPIQRSRSDTHLALGKYARVAPGRGLTASALLPRDGSCRPPATGPTRAAESSAVGSPPRNSPRVGLDTRSMCVRPRSPGDRTHRSPRTPSRSSVLRCPADMNPPLSIGTLFVGTGKEASAGSSGLGSFRGLHATARPHHRSPRVGTPTGCGLGLV